MIQNLKYIFFYSNVPPVPSISGAYRRVHSNMHHYIELGFNVIFFFNGNISEIDKIDRNTLNKISFIRINPKDKDYNNKFNYKDQNKVLGFFVKLFFNESYVLRNYIIENILKIPTAIHHFEYIQNAISAIGLKGNFIWSNHDHISKRYLITTNNARNQNSLYKKVYRLYKYILLRFIERIVIGSMDMVLTISSTECHDYQKVAFRKVFHLPFCIKNNQLQKSNEAKNLFKIIHLGNLDAILPFQSLKNIVINIFPYLSKEILEKFELVVIGDYSGEKRFPKIKELIEKYENISLLGFVDDLSQFWDTADLHIIASDEEIGIRTKIVESFANKVPVICIKSTARGLVGLKHLENILLPETFSEMLIFLNKIIKKEIDIENISQNGYDLYKKRYSMRRNTKEMNYLLKKTFYGKINA